MGRCHRRPFVEEDPDLPFFWQQVAKMQRKKTNFGGGHVKTDKVSIEFRREKTIRLKLDFMLSNIITVGEIIPSQEDTLHLLELQGCHERAQFIKLVLSFLPLSWDSAIVGGLDANRSDTRRDASVKYSIVIGQLVGEYLD